MFMGTFRLKRTLNPDFRSYDFYQIAKKKLLNKAKVVTVIFTVRKIERRNDLSKDDGRKSQVSIKNCNP